jgi:hypothetical protein
MTSNEQYPGSDQPLEPVSEPLAPQAPLYADTPGFPPAQTIDSTGLDDPTTVKVRGIGQLNTPPSQPQTSPNPNSAPTPYPAPGQAGTQPGVPSGGWGAPPSQPFAAGQPYTPGQPYPAPAYATGPGAGTPGTPYPAPGGYPAPGQAFPGQAAPGAAYPFPTGGQPPATGKAKGSKVPLFIGLGVLVVVLALVGFFALRGLGGSTPGQASSAKAAVQGYLEALAASDASTAIDFGATAPSDTALLTDEMLKAANARAAISNISVKDGSGSTTSIVTATYSMGATSVTGSFETTKIGSQWRLKETTRDVHLFSGSEGDLTLNGLAFTSTSTLTLFPGSYVLATPNDRVTVDGGEFVIKSPMDYVSPTLTFDLSEKGKADARDATQALLDSCLKQDKLAPTGCGFGFKAGGVKVKSVRWRVTSGASAIQDASFSLVSSNSNLATAYPIIQLEVTVKDTAGRTYIDQTSITKAQVDLSGADVVAKFIS